MGKNTNLELKNSGIPTPVSDSLTELLREGARRMLMEVGGSGSAGVPLPSRNTKRREKPTESRTERVFAGTDDPDRIGTCPRQGPAGSRPGRRDPVSSAVPPSNQKPCRTVAVVVSPRDLHRRLQLGSDQSSGTRRPGTFCPNHPASEGVLNNGTSGVGQTGPVEEDLRLSLGGRDPFQCPDGRGQPLRSGRDRSDERREEGTSGHPGRLSGKRTVLEGATARFEEAGIVGRPQTGRVRRGPRILESPARSFR